MPKQSLLAMKVAFGVRAQYTAVFMAASLVVFQVIGAIIFAGTGQAVGAITYSRSIDSRPNHPVASIAKDSSGNIYAVSVNEPKIVKYNSSGVQLSSWGSVGTGNGQFGNGPSKISGSPGDKIYALDKGNNRVQVFNTSGTFVAAFGSAGSGDGQFDFSTCVGGVAADSSGNIYVGDPGNHRVQKFDSSYQYVSQWGTSGTDPGQFGCIRNVAADSAGNVYVSEGGAGGAKRVQKFDSSGAHLLDFTDAGMNQASGVDIDGSGNVYVADEAQNKMWKFDSSATLTQTTTTTSTSSTFVLVDGSGNAYIGDGDNGFGTPAVYIRKIDSSGATLLTFANSKDGVLSGVRAVASGADGSVYVAMPSINYIQKYDNSGGFVRSWPTQAALGGAPVLATDTTGNVYLADGNNMIIKYDSSGALVTSWGGAGSGDGQLDGVRGLSVDLQGNVYITEANNSRVQKFDSSGTYLAKWGTSGSGDGQFGLPTGVAADAYGNVYVADTNNHRVQKFDSSGTFLAKWGTSGGSDGQFSTADAVAVDPSGRVYVSDSAANRVQKFAADGTFIAKWGAGGTSNGQFDFSSGSGLAVASDQTIYVADSGNNRVQVFTDNSFDLRLTTRPVSNVTQTAARLNASTTDLLSVVSATYNYQIGTTTSYGTETDPANVAVTPTRYWGNSGSGNGEFSNALGIAQNGSGQTYVTDYGNNRVQILDSSGNYVGQWGSTGSGNGQFNGPTDIAVAPNGNVYVADGDNDRVQVFDSAGVYVSQITGFTHPKSLAIDTQGNLYVSDVSTSVVKYDSANSYITSWVVSTSNGNSIRLAVSPQDKLFITSQATYPSYNLDRYALDGTFESRVATAGVPQGVATDADGNVYLIGSDSQLRVYTPSLVLSSTISADSNNYSFSGIKVNPDGNVLLAPYQPNKPAEFRATWQTDVIDLTCATTYHYRAKATVGSDVFYGADQQFTTSDCPVGPGLTITTTSLPGGTVGVGYSQSIATDSGSPVTFSLASGTLPSGLSLSGSGEISGSPTAAGTYTFTVSANDGSNTDTQDLSIVVAAAPVVTPITITTTSLDDGVVGEDYEAFVEADSAIDYTFSIVSGSLPDGLSMSETGAINGVPLKAGTSTFTVRANNGSSTDDQALRIVVKANTTTQPPITDEPPVVTPQDPPAPAPAVVKTSIKKTSPIKAMQQTAAAENSLFALAKQIPVPLAIGFPWLLLLLALILVSSQYYQVHSESQATRQMLASLAHQKQLVEEQNNFVALSTHYLHTPLTVMEGEISLMVRAGTLTQTQANTLRASLASINSEAEKVLAQEDQEVSDGSSE